MRRSPARTSARSLVAKFSFALSALCVLLAAAGAHARAADADAGPTFESRPDWIAPVDLPELREERLAGATGGRRFVLLDQQIKVAPGDKQLYTRVAVQVLDAVGLEDAGRLTFEYDPSYQQLVVHSIAVRRGGETLDRLEPASFHLVRQEPRLHEGEVLGDLTAFVHLPQIQVGDVIDYEWSLTEAWPLWSDGFAGFKPFAFSASLGERRLRLLSPVDMPVRAQLAGVEAEAHRREVDGKVEHLWVRRNLEPVVAEDHVPAEYPEFGFVEFSTMQGWAEVAQWGLGVVDVDMSLPPEAMAAALGPGAARLREDAKISRLIRYVQDEIRYVGDEVGLGSHVPRPPGRALALGYGDCKDKSLLLVAMLGELGVEAEPVFTHSRRGRGLRDRLPSPFVFNHMIVRARSNGGWVYVDPTLTHQGGTFPKLAAPDYGFGLPLRAGQADLEPIVIEKRALPTMEVIETFDFADLDGAGLAVEVDSIYRGREADDYRWKLARNGQANYDDSYLSYYQDLYPGLERQAALEVLDGRDRNVLITKERYRLPPEAFFAGEWRDEFLLKPAAVWDALPELETSPRRAPIAIAHPLNRRHRHRFVNLPDVFVPVDQSHENAVASARRYSRKLRNGFEITTHLETRVARTSAAGLEDVSGLNDWISNTAFVSYSFMDKERGDAAAAKPRAEPSATGLQSLVCGFLGGCRQ